MLLPNDSWKQRIGFVIFSQIYFVIGISCIHLDIPNSDITQRGRGQCSYTTLALKVLSPRYLIWGFKTLSIWILIGLLQLVVYKLLTNNFALQKGSYNLTSLGMYINLSSVVLFLKIPGYFYYTIPPPKKKKNSEIT